MAKAYQSEAFVNLEISNEGFALFSPSGERIACWTDIQLSQDMDHPELRRATVTLLVNVRLKEESEDE